MALLPIVLTSLLLTIITRLFLNKYNSALNAIPGPFLAGFTDLWRLYDVLFCTPHKTQTHLHAKHASTFIRIGPRTVSISNPSLIPRIYGINSGFSKSDFYTVFMTPYKGQLTPSLFNATDETYRAKINKPIASAYSLSTVLEFELAVDSTTKLFFQRLGEFAESGKAFDFNLWLQMWALDVIGEIVLSKRLGFLERGENVDGIIADIRMKTKLGGIFGQVPWLDGTLMKNPVSRMLMPTHPIVQYTVDQMAERVEKRRRKKVEGEKRDFLARCYEAMEKYPDIVTERMIRTYNVDNIIGGSDTIAISLSSVFYHLILNPISLARLLAEIKTLPPFDNIFTWKDTNTLPYLQAVIKEGVRMQPVVGLLLERVVPPGGISLSDHYFPEGTILGYNPSVIARSRDIYGQDADSFRPERWLEASPEQLHEMERASMAFGSGGRVCVGRGIAMLEMTKIVPAILRRYEVRLRKGKEACEAVGGWFVRLKDFEVVVRKRDE